MKQQHPYHIVALSYWPILSSFSLMVLALGGVMFLHKYSAGKFITIFGALSVSICAFGWWRDVINEGIVQKHHTSAVRQGLRIGMSLFILSEIMFFLAFFFSFFSASLFPVGI